MSIHAADSAASSRRISLRILRAHFVPRKHNAQPEHEGERTLLCG